MFAFCALRRTAYQVCLVVACLGAAETLCACRLVTTSAEVLVSPDAALAVDTRQHADAAGVPPASRATDAANATGTVAADSGSAPTTGSAADAGGPPPGSTQAGGAAPRSALGTDPDPLDAGSPPTGDPFGVAEQALRCGAELSACTADPFNYDACVRMNAPSCVGLDAAVGRMP